MNDETTRNREDSEDDVVWTDLIRWVQDGKGTNDDDIDPSSSSSSSSTGGYVHPSLALRGKGPSRGIKATAPIAKGELLIRIGSRHVLSGATETETIDDEITAAASAASTSTSTSTASPWLKCVGAFLNAKRTQQTAGSNGNSAGHGPYLNSLPSMKDYETLHKWSTQDEVEPFLMGTTLGNLVGLDRSTKGIQTRYLDSVEPYLHRIGAIDGKRTESEKETSEDKNEVMETNNTEYQSFLEASMCISTRGFHLLPAIDTKEAETVAGTIGTANDGSKNKDNNGYDGPFLLPVIDLLNHDPQNSCTTLRRHQGTGNEDGGADSWFVMVAEREIAMGEEIFHSYGSNMTSAQLLQTFGFVSRKHSSDAVAAAASDPPKGSQTATPVGLRAKDHLIAAARSLKASTFPDSVMDHIRTKKGQSTVRDSEEENDEEDEDDCFWEVCDIPDRPDMASDDEFLVSASQAHDTNGGFLLTEDTVTLMAAQFLPGDAFDEIFPSGDDAPNTVRLDRSILIDDYFLGMLVCKSLLVALFLKARDYCDDEGKANAKDESAEFIAKAISGAAPAGFVGRYLSSLLKNETARIRELLETVNDVKGATATTTMVRVRTEREIYGRTIRTEELTNLSTFCKEIEDLMATLSLGEGGENESVSDVEEQTAAAPQHDRDVEDAPPHKRARAE